ncbi:MAG: aspartyl protease family protein [Deltaproteobacteria bacterium]|nr:aspartyl protease family protein [Deltaproteobacteria bacterium]
MASALLAAGCLSWPAPPTSGRGPSDPALAWRMPILRRSMSQGARAADGLVLLAYSVEGGTGAWTREIVLGPDGRNRWFAERRTRRDEPATYAFGEDSAGAWLAVGPAPARSADDVWLAEARTDAALFGAGFLVPRRNDEAAFVGREEAGWELAFRPAGGGTLTFFVARRAGRPTELDVQDLWSRLVACDDVSWVRRASRVVPARMRCRTVNGSVQWGQGVAEGHRTVETRFRLERANVIGRPPIWARASPDRPPPVSLGDPVVVPIADPRRIYVDLEASTGASRSFILDSGASYTAMDEETARAFGVVPTGEAPLIFRPPWLPEHRSWIGVVDRMRAGGAVIDGARVLVMENMEGILDGAGLVGLDVFRRFVVEVDSPAAVLRLHAPERYRPPADAKRVSMLGSRRVVEVEGEVEEVARGRIIVDTGADVEVVVHDPAMAVRHRRRPGTDAFLSPRDTNRSPDYWTEVAGLRLGPFPFPATTAIGRDRERERLGDGIALVGMGLLRHLRLAFDCDRRRIWASPGPSYETLVRAGIELEDETGGPRVSRVVPGGSGEAAGVQRGDVLVDVDGAPAVSAIQALAAIGRRASPTSRLRIRRAGRERSVTLALW